jgi:hypothetical protein
MNNSTLKRGQPPLPIEAKKSEIILFRLTIGEKASLNAIAQKRGLSLTALIREALTMRFDGNF